MQSLRPFVAGFQRFQKQYFQKNKDLFSVLQQGQKPKVLVIACSDSRVDPALLTDCSPGDMFVIRNVANLVPPFCPDQNCHGVSSAIEYAVQHLAVEQIVILGHSNCGGITALMQPTEKVKQSEFIYNWMSIANRAKEHVLEVFSHESVEKQQRACELASILVSLENLLTFPWIAKRVEAGQLNLVGCYFDLVSGELFMYNAEEKAFACVIKGKNMEKIDSNI